MCANVHLGHGVEGSLKALLVVVQGAKTLVSMKWRYPIGGRLVSRIEAGFKGAGTPFLSKGFGESEISPIGATRLNAFNAPTAKRDATGEVPTVSLAKIAPISNFAHANL
jgi:hypothetical protein